MMNDGGRKVTELLWLIDVTGGKSYKKRLKKRADFSSFHFVKS